MRSDGALDHDIKALEVRIHDRRRALRESFGELSEAAVRAKNRVRRKAASPAVWGGALVLGFVAARLARTVRHRAGPRRAAAYGGRADRPVSTTRQVVGAVLSAAVPLALRIAQRSAGPWIARTVHAVTQRHARRHADGSYERY